MSTNDELENSLILNRKIKVSEILSKIENGSYKIKKVENAKSDVWKLFKKIFEVVNSEEKFIDYVQCEKCNTCLVYSKKTTSNLLNHPCMKKNKQDKIKVKEADKKKLINACTHWGNHKFSSFFNSRR